ncbi:carboxylesterase/lipase family protein [Rhizohabitans arisaemae]|uniref:carboxylesterase/lipase family protein n=1 Tax=Rhizohabitans arisaemae TaxID=2720610 RepID=UPI0024B1C977|nr:carboxylesterase family protein [Rhizohabitans arisaemae]
MSRRMLAALAVPLIALTPGPADAGTKSDPTCVVENDLCAYRGIYYAKAKRFGWPSPTGSTEATGDRKVCPQVRDNLTVEYPDKQEIYLDENCLTLNVWAPKPDGRKRPVIVFIHGGAARFGTANEPRYAGDRLAGRGDAVVVTINYRLGILGRDNNGLRDQIAALTWVRDHIGRFGGDPGKVTAVGQSEGAFHLSAMLATEHPERLFRRVILQSGSGALVHSAAYQRRLDTRFPDTDLRKLPVAEILKLQEKVLAEQAPGILGAVYFGPYIDGNLVRGPVVEQLAKGNARGIDLMLGTTRDEMNFFAQLGTPEGLAAQYEAVFFPKELHDRRARVVAAYRKGRTAQQASLAMFTDQGMRVPAIRMAEAQSRWRPTYLYQFDWQPPKGFGAVHTIELPFVFGSFGFTGIAGGAEAYRADRRRLTALSNRMIDSWTSFARTGDPKWPAYRAPRRATMIWDVTPKVVDDPRGSERRLWDGMPFTALDLG